MNEQFHIIIAGENGKIYRLPCSKKKLITILSVTSTTLCFLLVASFFTISLFTKNQHKTHLIAQLQKRIAADDEIIAQHRQHNEEEQLKLNLQLTNLELCNVKQAAAFKKEKEALISNAVSELTERSELIENIISSIGIKLPKNKQTGTKNSGGPFIESPDKEWDKLLYKTDRYLDTIRYLPFGRPLKGQITSRFGKRIDPVNHKKGFHTGIDFRAKRGEKIYATADGIVRKAFRNGGYGNYVLIDHRNGYSTIYAHMQAYLVHRGDRVKRGQIIGLAGNTGRSTGPHLHYEICLNKKPINPYMFIKIAKAIKLKKSLREKKSK